MQNSVTEVRVEPCTAVRQSGRVRVGPRRPSDGNAQLRVRKSGDRVEAIIVTCACGEETTILCDYPAKVSD